MIVSKREEALAQELYELDMRIQEDGYVSWDKQISFVKTHYRRLAARVVGTKWFAEQTTSVSDRPVVE